MVAQPAQIHFIEEDPIRFRQRDLIRRDFRNFSVQLVNDIEDVVSQSHAEVVLSHLRDEAFSNDVPNMKR